MRLALSLLAFVAAAPAAGARGTVIFAGGSWAAIDRGASCEAAARSVRVAQKGKVQAVAGFTFTADRRRWGEFHARLSRMPRGDATVMLNVGGQLFLLAARNGWAWSSGPRQADAIIAAIRLADRMRVDSRDLAGRRFSDPYALAGAPTAIDAAAAACAGKIRRP